MEFRHDLDHVELAAYLLLNKVSESAVNVLQGNFNTPMNQLWYDMDSSFRCAECDKLIEGGLGGLSSHFRRIHGFVLTKGGTARTFTCGQGGCLRQFHLFSSMRRHIEREHYDGFEVLHAEGDGNNVDAGVMDAGLVRDEPVDAETSPPHAHDENEDSDSEGFDVEQSVLRMVCNLRSNSAITGSVLTEVMDEAGSVMDETVNSLKRKVTKFFTARNMMNDPEVGELLQNFEVDNAFEKLRTLRAQLSSLKKNKNFIEPEEVYLGERVENVFHRASGEYRPTTVHETYQYVPVIKILQLVMSNKCVREAVLSEQGSQDGFLRSFRDGNNYKNSDFFQQHPQGIRLKFYYDDVGVNNPIGSKAVVHKLAAFYIEIMNVPSEVNSLLSSIHTVILCCDQDVRKYGFRAILHRFLSDVSRLESDEGVTVICDGQEVVLHGTIAAFCGDSLAVHEIFGLLGPSANKFCRLCMCSRQDLHAGNINPAARRTRELYAEHLAYVEEHPADNNRKTQTGVQGDCALHVLRHFHLSSNFVFDAMHDLLEGIVPFELKLVIHHFVLEEHLFSVDYLNQQVFSFNYGLMESRNKPSPNFSLASLRNLADHSLKQKAAQMWCLVRAFPFLVAEKVEPDDRYMHLILLLLRIMEIVFAPKLTESLLPYFTALIDEHNHTFKLLFPDVNFINKNHHLVHYPECIRESGPPVNWWCMRFEGKHNVISKHGKIVNNFINPPKTLIRVAQFTQCSVWGDGEFQIKRVKSSGGSAVQMNTLQCAADLRKLGYLDFDVIFSTPQVFVNGSRYKVGLFVCMEAARTQANNLPLFGKIKEIVILHGNQVFFLVSVCLTHLLDTRFNAYCMEPVHKDDAATKFLPIDSLADYKALSSWRAPDSPYDFLCLRHIVL